MKRFAACDVVEELVRCWRKPSPPFDPLVTVEMIGFEWGLRFALNYPEYAIALRNSLDSIKGDDCRERFLVGAAAIIEQHPIEVCDRDN